LLEDGVSIRAADMPGADDLMMRIYAAMAQKERELISGKRPVSPALLHPLPMPKL
jgi:DNA invertase Pin-like site-specific DNA recombinase